MTGCSSKLPEEEVRSNILSRGRTYASEGTKGRTQSGERKHHGGERNFVLQLLAATRQNIAKSYAQSTSATSQHWTTVLQPRKLHPAADAGRQCLPCAQKFNELYSRISTHVKLQTSQIKMKRPFFFEKFVNIVIPCLHGARKEFV